MTTKRVRDTVKDGAVFGRLTVIQADAERRHGIPRAVCKCTCGQERIVYHRCLYTGNTQSCGCLLRERTKLRATKHGHTANNTVSSTYGSWNAMLRRCLNPNDDAYPSYGGRGITVCERWRSFSSFLADMGECPEGTTLDRYPNNNGNYEPKNVRWATPKEQANNRSTNRILEHEGRTQSVALWADETGIFVETLRHRLARGWTIARALTEPVHTRHRTRESRGLPPK